MRNATFQRTASFAFCFGSSLIPFDFGEHVARHPRIVLASKAKRFLLLEHGDVICVAISYSRGSMCVQATQVLSENSTLRDCSLFGVAGSFFTVDMMYDTLSSRRFLPT